MTSIHFAIDYGEIEESLQNMHAAGMALAGTVIEEHASEVFRDFSEEEFGDFIDREAMADPLRLGHVYEYGEVGQNLGRLWKIRYREGDGRVFASVDWLPSSEPMPIDPELEGDARAAGRSLATHFFPDKARVLESGPETYTIHAGVQRYTERVGGDVSRPDSLVFMSNGNVVFAKSATQTNFSSGQFEAAWNDFFTTHARKIVVQDISQKMIKRVVPKVESELGKAAATVRMKSTPRVTASTPTRGVDVTVKGQRRQISTAPNPTFFRKVKSIVKRMIK